MKNYNKHGDNKRVSLSIGDVITISDGFDRKEHRKIEDIMIHKGEKRYKLEGIFKTFSADEFR